MSALTIYHDLHPEQTLLQTTDSNAISTEMKKIGIRYEIWPIDESITEYSAPDQILAAYMKDILRLVAQEGYRSWDVVALNPEHPDKTALRQKFLSEHTHGEDEVRFFVAGQGLFSVHVENKVYSLLCKAGDLISVPAGIKHWFDMGHEPHFVAIRLFNNPDGWIAQFTGDQIAKRFPALNEAEVTLFETCEDFE